MPNIDDIPEIQNGTDETADCGDSQGKVERNSRKSENGVVNKRIDFEAKSLKRIEMMIPAFRDEVGSNASANDVMSYIVGKGIDALFDGEFKNKLEEM
ncbi:hypothetical protein E0765_07255 [Sulfuricurvum sp. IAE1]|uniref:hypothetical protein n=1 Tax=Sulfuricurvum sp. IAE1 TaxID=2546102 RepID=UPI00104CFE19|nr:hypothetical protein [Sulfuricurvum sp. IAE1]TDA63625.1 hypothetical protein E0765_07255 [Sulfuricurvum sp. IAE1]